MEKNFDQWNRLKQNLDSKERLPTFKQREIWWCSLGLNIGHEENGKSNDCSRPILILRKFNHHIFFGIPLTTQIKEKHYYHKVHFKNKEQCVMISQLRLFDSKRLINEIRDVLKGLI
jgi:mRNA interferase MazF